MTLWLLSCSAQTCQAVVHDAVLHLVCMDVVEFSCAFAVAT